MEGNGSVVIVGGGPVGLCLAVELGQRGANVVVIEPCADTAERVHPRARYVNVRTATHFRRWGLVKRMRAAAEFPESWPSDVVFTTRLTEPTITTVRDAFLSAPVRNEQYPEPAIQLVQSQVEQVMRTALAEMPNVNTLYGWRCESASQGNKVSVRAIEDSTSSVMELDADYLVGCDGAGSTIRRIFEFKMDGQANVAQNAQIIFSAPDLYRVTGLGRAMMYWCLNREYPCFVSPVNTTDCFFVSLHKIEDVDRIYKERAQIVRSAIGPGVDFKILNWDPWVTSARIVENYRKGRVFLCGDAAHQHPTYGGHGLNLGIGDAVDLGWKIVAVLNGWCSDTLLDSYDAERRPVGKQVVDETMRSFRVAPKELAVNGAPETPAEREALGALIQKTKAPQFRSVGTQLGYSYAGSPLIISDEQGSSIWNTNSYEPDGAPGAIAPHHWLPDGSSIYDLFGQWFTLLIFDESQHSEDIAERLSDARSDPAPDLRVVRLHSPALQALYGAPIALIRPDQHVAWRGGELPDELPRFWNHVAKMGSGVA